MIKKALLAATAALIIMGNAHAGDRFINPNGMTEIHISASEPNRIAISNDRITGMADNNATIEASVNPNAGDLFIGFKQKFEPKAFTTFLITERGESIHVRFVPKRMPSTNTKLYTRHVSRDAETAQEFEQKFSSEKIASWEMAKQFEKGMILPGFETENYAAGDIVYTIPAMKPFSLSLTKLAVGASYRLDKLKVTNNKDKNLAFTERLLNEDHTVSVWVVGSQRYLGKGDHLVLKPGQSVDVIRVHQNRI